MKIYVKDSTTAAETLLAAGSARAIGAPVGPSSLSLSGSVAEQLRKFLRGTSAANTNRGNDQSRISWTVNYEFASQLAAETFAITHSADVQRGDQLRLVVDNPGGESVVVKIPDAVIGQVAIAFAGVGVSVTYSANGGAAERIET